MLERKETTEERWVRWDVLINEGKYLQLVKEFDNLLAKRNHLTIGDMVRRDDALELMGITSFTKEKAKRHEDGPKLKIIRGKSKTKNGNPDDNNGLRK